MGADSGFLLAVFVRPGREMKTETPLGHLGDNLIPWATMNRIVLFLSMVFWVTLKCNIEVMNRLRIKPSPVCSKFRLLMNSVELAVSLVNPLMAAHRAVFYLFVAWEILGLDQSCHFSLRKQNPGPSFMSSVSIEEINCNLNYIYLHVHIQDC